MIFYYTNEACSECLSRVLGKVASFPTKSGSRPHTLYENKPNPASEPSLTGFFICTMPYFVYILQSLVDGTFYTGYTKDINKRLVQHNNAKTGYSAKKSPWKLVYYEAFEIKTLAIKRERFIKKPKEPRIHG